MNSIFALPVRMNGRPTRGEHARVVIDRHQRQETERFHVFPYEELLKRYAVSLDLFWLRDESLEGAVALPAPEVLAASIVEDLLAALEQFAAITEALGNGRVAPF